MARAASHLAPLLVLAGCSQELTVALPWAPGTRSIVLALERPTSLEVHAFPADVPEGTARVPLRFSIEGDEAIRMTALLYTEPLEALGLDPGVQSPLGPGEPGEGLPGAEGLFAAELSAGGSTPWSPIDAVPGAVAAFRIPARPERTRCDAIEVTPYAVTSTTSNGYNSVALESPEAVWVVPRRSSGPAQRMLRSGDIEIRRFGNAPTAAVSDHRGTVYIGTYENLVHQLDANGEEIVATPVPFLPVILTAAPDGTVFAAQQLVDTVVAVELVRGSTQTRPAMGPPSGVRSWFVASRTRMAAATPQGLHVYDGERWVTELTGADIGRGAVFGDETRMYFVSPGQGVRKRDDETGEWRPLPDPGTATFIVAGGLLEGEELMVLGETGASRVYDGDRWCGLNTGTLRSLEYADIAPTFDRAVAVSEDTDAVQAIVWFDLGLTNE